jgi:hypothetical protein
MKPFLRLLAMLVVLASAACWLAAGAHRGWSMDSVPRKTVDEITGLEGIRYEKRFVPGLDFLVAAAAAAGLLAGASFFFPTPNLKPESKSNA